MNPILTSSNLAAVALPGVFGLSSDTFLLDPTDTSLQVVYTQEMCLSPLSVPVLTSSAVSYVPNACEQESVSIGVNGSVAPALVGDSASGWKCFGSNGSNGSNEVHESVRSVGSSVPLSPSWSHFRYFRSSMFCEFYKWLFTFNEF